MRFWLWGQGRIRSKSSELKKLENELLGAHKLSPKKLWNFRMAIISFISPIWLSGRFSLIISDIRRKSASIRGSICEIFVCINYLGSRFDKISSKEMAIWPFDTIKCVRWNSPAEIFLNEPYYFYLAGQTWAHCAPRASMFNRSINTTWLYIESFYPVFSLPHSPQFKIQRVQLFFGALFCPWAASSLSQLSASLSRASPPQLCVCVVCV